ncbi:hypothetical protein Uis4E_1458 [Bifidobacterium parmae]|uniref:Uncharacterized protein n=1 Tax=Bifidobacterium parmae TaxID=361854 RepID=A0A2N5J0D7_9BIFI|nr:hypothetical protein Uis4E_1458 [Bifidobacterium parmae]
MARQPRYRQRAFDTGPEGKRLFVLRHVGRLVIPCSRRRALPDEIRLRVAAPRKPAENDKTTEFP